VDDLINSIVSLAIAGAIVWTFFRTLLRVTLEPLHNKLDRLIELQERHNDDTTHAP
jgi:hypothetical protein